MQSIAMGVFFGAAGAHALVRPTARFWRSRYSAPQVRNLGMVGVTVGAILIGAGIALG